MIFDILCGDEMKLSGSRKLYSVVVLELGLLITPPSSLHTLYCQDIILA